jgi:hypothetical protein
MAQATAPEQRAPAEIPTAPPPPVTATPPEPAPPPAQARRAEPEKPQQQAPADLTQQRGSTRGPVTIQDEGRIGRARLTSNVVNREPVDELGSSIEIPAGGKAVFFFTEVRAMGGRTVTHRWLRDGNAMASVPFQIGSDRWRVYSRKVIGANETGSWTVVAVGSDGNELARAAFTVE